jgi:predicted phosphodiesterase
MAKGDFLPILVTLGLVGIGGVAIYFAMTKKEGEAEKPSLDLQGIIDSITNLFKIPPAIIDTEPPEDGNGNGEKPKPDGDKEPVEAKGSITLGAAGDWGSGRNSNWQKTVSAMKAAKVDVMLGLGDYSYTSVGDWQKVIDALKKAGILIAKGAEGNHDGSSYAKTFGQGSFLYTFNAGSACIIALNTENGSGGNVAYAEKILKATKQPWKILIMHKCLYTGSSKHGEEKSLASALKPIINKYGVQLVMYAHNHNYQRIVKSDQPKCVFICSGTGGESHYGIKGSASGTKAKNDSAFGFTKIVISGNTLKGSFINTSNKTLDSWTQTLSSTSAQLAEIMVAQRISI